MPACVNCDPTDITYPIPGNDDAIRAISLFVEIIANAVIDADNEVGIQIIESLPANEEEAAALEAEGNVVVDKDAQDSEENETKDEE